MAEVIVLVVVEDVVDAVGGKSVSEIGGSETFAAASEAVFESVSDFVCAVGCGRVVEVTADDNRESATVDVRADAHCLILPLLESIGDFVVQFGCLLLNVGVAHVVVQ